MGIFVQVKYEFQDCCRSLQGGIEDGSRLSVEIHSLPMYDSADNRHYASAELEIPEPSGWYDFSVGFMES